MALKISRERNDVDGPWVRGEFSRTPTNRANRRRLRVFVGTLAVCLAIGLTFTWLRPAEYRASAHLEITPGSASAPAEPPATAAPGSAGPLLTEIQILTSRPVLEEAAARLESGGYYVGGSEPDPVASLQSHLETIPVPNTNVVELVATGRRPALLAPLVNTVIEVYRDRLAAAHRDSSADSLEKASEEARRLEAGVTNMRQDAEAFRLRNNIVSPERDENEILARTRELGASLAAANGRVTQAENRLHALSASAAAGEPAARSKDESTLANLEQRASQLREQLANLDRDFTPDFLAKDQKVIAQRKTLADLERQIKVQREASHRAAVAEAKEELASAQTAAAQLQGRASIAQKELGQFTARFNEYKAKRGQLDALEKAHQDASLRLARLDATERARTPTLNVLEAATTPGEAWRPLYWRDTGICIGASLVLALLAMWLVELFNRPEPQPSMVLIQPQSGGLGYAAPPITLMRQTRSAMALDAQAPALLAQPPSVPRELEPDEAARLVRAADEESRLVVLLLLSGISLDEALALRRSDVDFSRGVINVGGGSARAVVIHDPLRALTSARDLAPRTEALLGQPDRPADRETIATQLLCAAHDAGIENATDVTAACLRHTYVAFLVRQGVRFADLAALIGHMPAELLGAYSALAPAGLRRPLSAIDVVYPASPQDGSPT